MKLYANEKLVSVHNRYKILDENTNQIYEVESKPISISRKTRVFDSNNNEIIYAEQKLFHLTSHYDIFIRGEYAFQIKQLVRFFKLQFEISNGYSVKGNFLSLEFSVFFNTKEVAKISRKFLSFGDKYVLDIYEEKDLELILAIVVVISNIIDTMQSSA